ncbi:MAG TPA: glycosyltransferase family 87 protein [Terriglobia bacterium]|nr:glycosyltransferase family 87 protein [Terriglobia bacterium]
MRTKIVNSALAIILAGGIYLGIVLHPVVKQNVDGGYFDFIVLYTGGSIVKEGHARHLYDYDVQRAVQLRVAGRETPLPFNRTPFEALALAPLALFPYVWAYRIWTLVNFLLIGLTAYVLRAYLENVHSLFLRVVLVLSASIPLFVGLVQGQDSLLMLFLFTLTFVSLKEHRESRAGFLLALALFKAQYVVPFVLIFFMKRRWKMVSAFLGVAVLLGLLSLSLIGWSGVADWVYLLREQNTRLPSAAVRADKAILSSAMPNLRGFLDAVLVSRVSPTALSTLVGLGSVVLLVWGIQRWGAGYWSDDRAFDLLFALNLVVALMVSYYEFIHDLVLIGLPILLVFSYFETSPLTRSPRRLIFIGSALLLFVVAVVLFNTGSRQFHLLFWPELALAFTLSSEIAASQTAETGTAWREV